MSKSGASQKTRAEQKPTTEGKPAKKNMKRSSTTDKDTTSLEPAKKKQALRKPGQSKKPTTPANSRPEQTQHDESIGQMDPALLADHFAKAIRKHLSDSTEIEIEEQQLSSRSIRDTTSFPGSRVAKNLSGFLTQFTEGGMEELSTCQDKGTPHTIVMAQSGIRTVDLVRELKTFNSSGSRVAKCFSKHMKLVDNVRFLKSTPVGIVVGTPTRLKELVEKDALDTKYLKRIVIDASYLDEKKRTILDMKEIFVPMLGCLNLKSVRERYDVAEGEAEILVF